MGLEREGVRERETNRVWMREINSKVRIWEERERERERVREREREREIKKNFNRKEHHQSISGK